MMFIATLRASKEQGNHHSVMPRNGIKSNMGVKTILYIGEIFIILAMLTSCCYCDLCDCDAGNGCEKEKAQLCIPVDWSHFDEDPPTGMTVVAYPADDSKPIVVQTNTLKQAELSVDEGIYHFMVFNQTTSEFGTLQFEGMDKYSTATVYAKSYQSRWYSRSDAEATAYSPEWLADGSIEAVRVTEYMAEADSTFAIDTVKPRNVISTVNIHVHVKNIYNIRSARASLTGLAAGYRFATNKPTEESVTQLIENWTLQPDADNPANGTLTASFQSFGLPADHKNTPEENELTLSLLLVDDKTQQDFCFQVGDKFVKKANRDIDTDIDADIEISTDVDLELELHLQVETAIQDVKPTEGSSSGFNATVEDWGDEEKIDINA